MKDENKQEDAVIDDGNKITIDDFIKLICVLQKLQMQKKLKIQENY